MKNLIRRSTTRYGALAAAVLFLMVSAIVVMANISHAATDQPQHKGRLITIYDRGTQKVELSDGQTIGDALKEADITLTDKDIVEPAASEKMIASSYQVNIYRARPVIIVDGMTHEKIITAYQTANQIAKDANITLYPEDNTTLTRIDNISDGAGLQLTIDRATPVNLVLYGKPTVIRTHATTVGDMLKEKGITLAASDTLSVAQSQPIVANQTIQLWRNGVQTINVDEDVAFDVTQIQNADQPVGYKQVQTPGAVGKKTTTYQVEMQNGIEVSRTAIQRVVTTPATAEVDVIGTKIVLSVGFSADQQDIMEQAGISSSDYDFAAYIINHENGLWCPTRWQGMSGCPVSYVALYAVNAQVGYGLCQATPGNKMASAGSDWETNPVTQMKWCNSYALSRYGSWQAAYQYWYSHHNW